MRDELAILAGRCCRYQATFICYGARQDGEITALLRRVAHDRSGFPVADHVWVLAGSGLRAVGPVPGRRLAFDARAERYAHREEYRLVECRNFAVLGMDEDWVGRKVRRESKGR